MALSFVGQASAAADSATLPTFTAGDLAIVFAFRDGNTTAPTLPSGWNNLGSVGANTCSARWGYRILVAGDTTTGTWTNATDIEVYVIRGFDAGAGFGFFQGAGNTGASASMTWSSMGLTDLNSRSWVLLLGAHRTATDTNTVALTGTTNESPATNSVAMHDVQGASAAWSSTSKTVNANSGWITTVIEVRTALPNTMQTSQEVIESVESPTSGAFRASQVTIESVEQPIPALRESQIVLESVATRSSPFVLSQIVVETVVRRLHETFQVTIID